MSASEELRMELDEKHAIAVQIEGMSEDILRVEEGSLYPALHRMEEAGWLASSWGESENNRRAKYYHLTAAGRRQLQTESDEWQKISIAIASALPSGPCQR